MHRRRTGWSGARARHRRHTHRECDRHPVRRVALTDLQLAASRHEPTAESMRALLALVAAQGGSSWRVAVHLPTLGAVMSTAPARASRTRNDGVGWDGALYSGRVSRSGTDCRRVGDTLFFDKVRRAGASCFATESIARSGGARGALTTIDSRRVGAQATTRRRCHARDRRLLRALTLMKRELEPIDWRIPSRSSDRPEDGAARGRHRPPYHAPKDRMTIDTHQALDPPAATSLICSPNRDYVVVADREDFPRNKVCGGGLTKDHRAARFRH
jgi:hypothetical protein